MIDKLIDDEARTLYELFTKSGIAITKANVDKITNNLNFSTPSHTLLPKLQGLERGLPIEDQFISLAVWMGNCKLIHKLEQEQFPDISRNSYQVPDLFAIFNYRGRQVPVLIEVKSDQKEKTSMSDYKFRLAARYYNKLNNYSKRSRLPLLIAWHAADNWTLFDIKRMKKRDTAYHISWDEATKEDLMFTLLGNLYFTSIPGVKYNFKLKEIEASNSKSVKEEDRYQFISMGYESPKGKQIKKKSRTQFVIWTLTDIEKKEVNQDSGKDIVLEATENQRSFPAYALLPYFLFYVSNEEKHPGNWRKANKKGYFGDTPFAEVKKALKNGTGTLFQDVIQLVPTHFPDFLLEHPTKRKMNK